MQIKPLSCFDKKPQQIKLRDIMAVATVRDALSPSSSSSIQLQTEMEVKAKFVEVAIGTIRTISADNKSRLASEDPLQLRQGVFYPNEHYAALLKHTDRGSEALRGLLVCQGSYFFGQPPTRALTLTNTPPHPAGKNPLMFTLKPDTTPSDALDAVIEGLTITDCANACDIAYYAGLRAVIGREKFDYIFAADGPAPFLLCDYAPKNPLLVFKQDGGPIEPGSRIYVSNVSLYPTKHLKGEANGHWLLCSGDDTFSTLGLLDASLEEVCDALLQEFNKPPFGLPHIPADLKSKLDRSVDPIRSLLQQSLAMSTLGREDFEAQGGGKIHTVNIDYSRVTAIANASFKEARRLVTSWLRPLTSCQYPVTQAS